MPRSLTHSGSKLIRVKTLASATQRHCHSRSGICPVGRRGLNPSPQVPQAQSTIRPRNCVINAMTHDTEPRKGMPDPKLPEAEFKRRFRDQFVDPAFDSLSDELGKLAAAAWDGYSH